MRRWPGRPCHRDRDRQQPADPQRHGAARRARRTMTRPRTISRSTPPARTRMSRGWCCRPSIRSRPSTSCASSRRMSAAASARRSIIYPEEIVCLWASKRIGGARSSGRPTGRNPSSPTPMAATMSPRRRSAFDANNRIIGFKVDTIANLGAYMSLFSSSCRPISTPRCCRASTTSPTSTAMSRPVYTNTTPVDAYRGAGRPEATFVVERIMETAARELGVDPAELRRKNFIREFPHQTPVIMNYDAGDYDASLDAGTEGDRLCRLPGSARRRPTSAASCAASASPATSRPAALRRRRRSARSAPASACGNRPRCASIPVGTIEVLTGSHSHGQGHETTFAQIDRRSLRPAGIDNVSIVHGDTDKVQFGMGTYGSRSGAVGMCADRQGARQGRGQGQEDRRPSAGGRRERHRHREWRGQGRRHRQEARLARGLRSPPIPRHNLPEGMEPGLKEASFYDPANFTFPAGAYVCEVEVDPDTGKTEIVQFVACRRFRHRIINPMIVEGQVHGGIAQGIGQALLEHAIYDPRRPAGHGTLHGLRHAARRRPAELQTVDTRNALPEQPARHEGLRRGRRHRLAAGGDQRDHRRDRQQRSRHAGDAGAVWPALQRPPPRWPPRGGSRRCTTTTITGPLDVADAAKLFARRRRRKLLAGGQTLLPTMKQRLAAPSDLIDLRHIAGDEGHHRLRATR